MGWDVADSKHLWGDYQCSGYKIMSPTSGATQSLSFEQVRLASPQLFLGLFSFCDVFGERHDELRHAAGAGNERNIVAYPDGAAVLTDVLLLDLKLCSLTFEELVDELPISVPVILMSEFQKA